MGAREAWERVMADPRVAEGGRFEGGRFTPVSRGARTYEDEPILRTGSEIARERAAAASWREGAAAGWATTRVEAPRTREDAWDASWERDLLRTLQPEVELPEPYQIARAFARGPEARRHSEAWVFRRQAEMLAEVTDDLPYEGRFERYFPTYQAMTDRQLRGYVTWRTRVRSGLVERTSTSFAFVYLYELLAGVGTSSHEEGFVRLRDFCDAYRELDPAIDRHARRWLRDYAVYYGVPVELARTLPSVQVDLAFDAALHTVTHAAEHTPAERFSALSSLASYHIRSSRFAKDFPDDVQAVTLGVVARLEEHYAKRCKQGLWETLFGTPCTMDCQMFDAAVFCEDAPHPDADYALGPGLRYACRDGLWTVTRMTVARGPNARLGVALKTLDALMRERYAYAHPLRMPPKVPKYLLAYIGKEIDARLTWKAAHAPRRIEIDRSALGGIRIAAAQTREGLLVDEERGEGTGFAGEPTCDVASDEVLAQDCVGVACAGESPAEGCPRPPGKEIAPESVRGVAEADTAPFGLTADELDLLRALLAGEPARRQGGASPDMLVDAINEKLFELLGDTALEFGQEGPVIIEDYLDDVRGIVAP